MSVIDETLLAASSNPTLGFVGWIVIGDLAGWIGSRAMDTDEQMGIALNIVVGIVGGFLGGWLLTLLGIGITSGGMFFGFLTCLLDVAILLWTIGLIRKHK